jgi:hypothetical protein
MRSSSPSRPISGRIVREWDAFRGNMCHGSESAAVAARESQRAMRDYVPYDPSFETPDEGGINGPPEKGSIRARVKPNRVQLAVYEPAQPLRAAGRPQRCDLSARDGPDLRLVHVS